MRRAPGPSATAVESPVEPVRPEPLASAFAPQDWALLFGIALTWGSSFLFIAIGIETLSPGLLTLLRLLFGAATLGVVRRARAPIPRQAWPRVAALGLFWMAGPFILFPIAEQWIESSLAGMINGAVPLFATLVASVMTRRAPSSRHVAGLLVGFAGVIAVTSPALRGAEADVLGTLLVLLATASYGLALNLAVPLQQRYGALPVLWRAQLVALAMVTPFGLPGLTSSTFSWPSVAAVAALGVLGTALAFVGMTKLVGRVGAARGSIAIYFLPIVAILLGVVFRNEKVYPISLGGTALVMLGAYLSSRRSAARPLPASSEEQVPSSSG